MIEYENLDAIVPDHLIQGLDKTVVQRILEDVAEAARNHWIMLAGEELNSTRRDYINGIQPVDSQPGMATISLVGAFPNFIENGGSQQDMRETLLGPNVPVSEPGEPGKHLNAEGGYYRSIPFRHTPPGGSTKTGTPMGSSYEGVVSDYEALGREVYDHASGLTATKTDPYSGGTKWGGRLRSPVGAPIAPSLTSKTGYTHRTNIYEGMVRQEKTYRERTQSQYTTFRTISTTGGDPGSWIRPAREGRHFADKVVQFAGNLAVEAFEAYVEGLVGEK